MSVENGEGRDVLKMKEGQLCWCVSERVGQLY